MSATDDRGPAPWPASSPPSAPRWLRTSPLWRSSLRMFSRYFTGMACSVPMRSPFTGPGVGVPGARQHHGGPNGVVHLGCHAHLGTVPCPRWTVPHCRPIERPIDPTPVHTELTSRPPRSGTATCRPRPGSRRRPSSWRWATTSAQPVITYKRRIGTLAVVASRAGPPQRCPLPRHRCPRPVPPVRLPPVPGRLGGRRGTQRGAPHAGSGPGRKICSRTREPRILSGHFHYPRSANTLGA